MTEEQARDVRLLFKYDGSVASTGELDLHDAAVALHGITRATVITAHAFLNEGKIRVRTDGFRGGRVFVQAPRRGSYEQIVRIVFDPVFLAGLAGGVASNAFWDFLKWTWTATVGTPVEPATAAGMSVAERIEPRLGDIAGALRRPFEEMHRPIERGDAAEMGLNRPRVGRILTFDEESLAAITEVIESSDELLVSGNVTRFNVLSGFGRLFDDARGETVSFLVSPSLNQRAREWLTWSLDQRNRHQPGKLLFTVSKVTGSGDEVIRYQVSDARGQQPN